MYSKNAIPQLTIAATYHGFCPRFLRCAYQANVMKTLESTSRPLVRRRMVVGIECSWAKVRGTPRQRPGTSKNADFRSSPYGFAAMRSGRRDAGRARHTFPALRQEQSAGP